MSRRKFLSALLLICSLTTAFGDDSAPSAAERTLRSTPQRLRCASKKDPDFVSEYKRLPEHRYVTEYKRFPEYRYSFGIGKRWLDNAKRNLLPYSFGVGKRSMRPSRFLADYLSLDNANYLTNDLIDQSELKRAAPMRSYDFGIGKRNRIQEELEFLPVDSHPADQSHSDTNQKISTDDEPAWEQY